jgi:TRAP-type mannitol/chloroaromatic compound transport system permease small subunit
MRLFLRAASAIDALNRRLAMAAAWLILVMVLVGAYNAVARYVERDLGVQLSSNALLEAQWYLFGLVFLFGAPHTLARGGHVRVDVLYGSHGPRGRAWIDLVGTLLLLLPFCALAIWSSWDFVGDSVAGREGSADPGGLPRWILKPAVPVGFALLALQGLAEAVRRIAVLRGLGPESSGLIADDPAVP